MSDELLQQLSMINTENNVLRQCVQEYLSANVSLRTQTILLENQNHMQNEMLRQVKEKVVELELKIKDLESQLTPKEETPTE